MVHNRLVLIDQIPAIKKRFETFTQYATTSFEEAFTQTELEDAYEGNLYTLASCIFVNREGKKFESQRLPEVAQLSTVNDLLIEDLNLDSFDDLILIGNNYSQETLFGMYDASIGCILLGDGNLHWRSLPSTETGFVSNKDAKMIKLLQSGSGRKVIISNNNDEFDVFDLQ